MMMQPKTQTFMVKGMRRDLSKGLFDSNYAFEIKNMRITTREDNTLLSLTNEKGNLEIAVSNLPSIQGSLLGWCVLNQNIILFTKGTSDYIYKIVVGETISLGTILFQGNLNFSTDNPIESIGIYENENIQKVYFVDGLNQPRVIDINKIYTNPDLLNFSNKISLTHSISIDKLNSGGIFPAGTIQYAFSYYNLNGQETNIFETTPLYYLSPRERGLSPEENASCAFNITLSNLDTNFNFIRIYSIVKTSIDSTPVVKRVIDLSISATTQSFTDTGVTGDIIDSMQLYYIGGESIIASTMVHKDNTLFLGDLKLKRNPIGTLIVSGNSLKFYARSISITNTFKDMFYSEDNQSNIFYGYKVNNNISSYYKKVFKAGETYRLGFIAQHETGKWSEVIWIDDRVNNVAPIIDSTSKTIHVGTFQVNLTDIKSVLQAAGYIRVAPVVVLPESSDRTIIAQGIVSPTVYNVLDRSKNAPFAQSSWFARIPEYVFTTHDNSLKESGSAKGEIQLQWDDTDAPYQRYKQGTTDTYMTNSEFVGYFAEHHMVDQSIVTFHSPEIEIGEDVTQGSLDGTNFRIVGYANFKSVESDVDLTVSTPGKDALSSEFIRNPTRTIGGVFNPVVTKYLVSNDLWYDKSTKSGIPTDERYGFVIYPWQRSGSLNDDIVPTDANIKRSAVLERKKMSHLLYGNTVYNGPTFQSLWTAPYGITSPQIFNSDVLSTIKIPSPTNSQLGALTYYGNIDRLVMPNMVDMSDKTLYFDGGMYYAGFNKSKGYPIYTGFYKYVGTDPAKRASGNYYKSNVELSGKQFFYIDTGGGEGVPFNFGTDPVHIKYKSSPHIVFAFNYSSSGNQVILPCHTTEYVSKSYKHSPFWIERSYNVECTNIDKPYTALWIGELYRPTVTNRFGGTTDQALLANQWLVAGPAVNLSNSSVIINYLEGDTYFARYDSLKTYPFTLEDTNSVTEIMSTYIESRVNLDARYLSLIHI